MKGKIMSASGKRKDENRVVEIETIEDLIILIKSCIEHSIIIYEEEDGTYLFVDYDDWWE